MICLKCLAKLENVSGENVVCNNCGIELNTKEVEFLSQYKDVLKQLNQSKVLYLDDFGYTYFVSQYFCDKKDYDNKMKCINFGLENNSKCCFHGYANSYYHGEGVEKDLVKCYELLKQTENSTFTKSIISLGYLYCSGNGCEHDCDKAISLFEKAVELGDTNAYTQWAFIYENNYNNKGYDYEEAARLHTLGAEGGNAVSQNQLGNFYCSGRGVKRNQKKARELYLLSAKQEEKVACHSLAELYEKGTGGDIDLQEALHWYKEAYRLGYTSAKRKIEDLEADLEGVDLDVEEQYKKACDYYFGENGVKENNNQALKWFNFAAMKKHASSTYYLGFMYLNGYGCDVNYKQAVTLMKEAVKLGDTDANYILGRLYLFGEHYKKNEEKALQYLLLAEGNKSACYYLGRIYENGLGVEIDLEKAKHYYQIASEKNRFAKKAYDVLMGTDSYPDYEDLPYEFEVYDAMHGDFKDYPHPIIEDYMIEYKIAHNCTGRFNDGYYADNFYDKMSHMHDWHEFIREDEE